MDFWERGLGSIELEKYHDLRSPHMKISQSTTVPTTGVLPAKQEGKSMCYHMTVSPPSGKVAFWVDHRFLISNYSDVSRALHRGTDEFSC